MAPEKGLFTDTFVIALLPCLLKFLRSPLASFPSPYLQHSRTAVQLYPLILLLPAPKALPGSICVSNLQRGQSRSAWTVHPDPAPLFPRCLRHLRLWHSESSSQALNQAQRPICLLKTGAGFLLTGLEGDGSAPCTGGLTIVARNGGSGLPSAHFACFPEAAELPFLGDFAACATFNGHSVHVRGKRKNKLINCYQTKINYD